MRWRQISDRSVPYLVGPLDKKEERIPPTGLEKELTYHPPASAIAASWASLTLGSSSPFSDMSGFWLESQFRMGC